MILITRLREDYLNTIKDLDLKKIKSISEPLYSIKYLSKRIRPSEKKIFVIPSYKSIKTIKSKKNFENLKTSTFFVIGERSNIALKKMSLKIGLVANDSEELLIKIKNSKRFKNHSYEYLCSNFYNKEFLKKMKEAGKEIKKNIIYKITPADKLRQGTIKKINQDKIRVVLVFSKSAGSTFIKLCKKHKIKKSNLVKIKFVSMSHRSGQQFIDHGLHAFWPTMPKLSNVTQLTRKLL